MGHRKALQPQEAVTSTLSYLQLCLYVVSQEVGQTCLPSRPAGLSRGPGLRTLGKTRTGGERRRENLQLGKKTANSKKQNLDLYSSCSWPAHDSGLPPTQGWPNKKVGKAGCMPPSGQYTELRKVSTGYGSGPPLPLTSSTGPLCPGL